MVWERNFVKYILVNAVGFGIGGLLWGWVLYSELPDLEYPFHFMAIVLMAFFGGVSLIWQNKNIRQISKSVLAGILGYGIGFLITAVFSYFLLLYSVLFLAAIPFEVDIVKNLINLKPSTGVGNLWLVFLFNGIIVGLLYSLFLKAKKWPLIWRGGIGFALGSLLGPIIGNLLGNAFNSLLISYLVTFAVIGVVLGKFLAWGVYKYKKA